MDNKEIACVLETNDSDSDSSDCDLSNFKKKNHKINRKTKKKRYSTRVENDASKSSSSSLQNKELNKKCFVEEPDLTTFKSNIDNDLEVEQLRKNLIAQAFHKYSSKDISSEENTLEIKRKKERLALIPKFTISHRSDTDESNIQDVDYCNNSRKRSHSKKRKAKNDDYEGKRQKLERNSPALKLRLKVDPGKGGHLTWKLCNSGTKSSPKTKNQDLSDLTNVTHEVSKTPTKQSARKNLFSPEKNNEATSNRECGYLTRTPNKVRSIIDSSFIARQSIPTQHEESDNLSTPDRHRRKELASNYSFSRTTPAKHKEDKPCLNSIPTEISSENQVKELSPTKINSTPQKRTRRTPNKMSNDDVYDCDEVKANIANNYMKLRTPLKEIPSSPLRCSSRITNLKSTQENSPSKLAINDSMLITSATKRRLRSKSISKSNSEHWEKEPDDIKVTHENESFSESSEEDSYKNMIPSKETSPMKKNTLHSTPQKCMRRPPREIVDDDSDYEEYKGIISNDYKVKKRTPLKEIACSSSGCSSRTINSKSAKENSPSTLATSDSKATALATTKISRRTSISKFNSNHCESSDNDVTPKKEASSDNRKTEGGSYKNMTPSKDLNNSHLTSQNLKMDALNKSPVILLTKVNLDEHLRSVSSLETIEESPKREIRGPKGALSDVHDDHADFKTNTPVKDTKSSASKTILSSSKHEDFHFKLKELASPLKNKQITVTTPVSKKKEGRGFLTPCMAKRNREVTDSTDSPLDITRKQLHISTVPKYLPCRDAEFGQIKSFLLRKIEHSAGGCMYISGVPGTGKTATVHAVIRALQEDVSKGDLQNFDFVEVNGLRLTEPRQAYVRIYQALTDHKLTPDQAQQLLNKRFSSACKRSTIILVDELDYLCNRRQDVVYNILDWPSKHSSALVVLTISNTMDLPERTLKGRVTSRMGLTRLTFQPYTHHQLREIVQDRLSGSTTFHPDAVQLVARKVAAVSGDARRALDVCRRTTELIQHSEEQITVNHVEEALVQLCASARVQVIKALSGLSQLVLRSVRDVCQRTGVDETSASSVYQHLRQLTLLERIPVPPPGALLEACVTLVRLGLLVAEKGRVDLTRKMSLNVSSDDIHYALDNV